MVALVFGGMGAPTGMFVTKLPTLTGASMWTPFFGEGDF